MYGPKYSNVAVKHQQLTDSNFTGWTQDLLMLHVEELEDTNYQNESFSTVIKLATTRKASGERKYKDTEGGENHAIFGLNTNSPDLCGLIRADEPVIDRLVILQFLAKPADLDWAQVKQELQLDHAHEASIGATMYRYLRDDYAIAHNFTPDRYYRPDKYAILKALRSRSQTSIEAWFAAIGAINDDNVDCVHQVLQPATWSKVAYVYTSKKRIADSYDAYTKANPRQASFKIDKVYEFMSTQGFEDKAVGGTHIKRITAEAFDKLVRAKIDATEGGEPDDVEFDCL
jgi:hypothetical protein